MEKEAENYDRAWTALCTVICVAGGTLCGTTLWGRQFNWKALLIIAVAGGIGGAIGFLFRKAGKRAKAASLVLCAVIFAALVGGAKYMRSDAKSVRQYWPRHTVNRVSFSYPGEFLEYELNDELLEMGTVKLYSCQDTDRFAHYMEYDFTGEHPTLEESVAGVVTNMLSSFRARTVLWSEDAYVSDTLVKARFTYTYNRKQFTGYVFGYAEGNHCEIVAFYPLRKQFSEAFLSKIENSIEVE